MKLMSGLSSIMKNYKITLNSLIRYKRYVNYIQTTKSQSKLILKFVFNHYCLLEITPVERVAAITGV